MALVGDVLTTFVFETGRLSIRSCTLEKLKPLLMITHQLQKAHILLSRFIKAFVTFNPPTYTYISSHGFIVIAPQGWDSLAMLSLLLECIAAGLEQHSNKKPVLGLIAGVITVVSGLLGFCDMLHRHKEGSPWLALPFVDWFGVILSLLQFITSLVEYVLYRDGRKLPWKFSTVSLAFAASVICVRLLGHSVKPTYQIVTSKGIVDDAKPISQFGNKLIFECPCAVEDLVIEIGNGL